MAALQHPQRLLATGALIVAVAVSACGGSGTVGGGSGGGSTQASAAPAAGPAIAQARQLTNSLYRGQDYRQPPSTSPTHVKGKHVWVITPGLALAGSQLFADATKAASKDLGWQLNVFDGKLNPSIWPDGIRQAIAAKADAIILYNIDCPVAQSAMKQARQAKIPLIAAESVDCSFAKKGAPSLFNAQVTYTEGKFPSFATSLGAAQASYVMAKTNGQAKIILFRENDLSTAVLIGTGFTNQIAKCDTCKVVQTVTFTASDTGPTLQQKAQQALLKHPDANVVVAPYDDVMVAGIGAAIVESGRKDKILSVAGAGFPANMDLVRKDAGQDAGYAVSVPWEGWSAIDTVNRVLNGAKPESSGIGVGFFDRTHNLPRSGPAVPPIDYASAYKRAWAGQG